MSRFFHGIILMALLLMNVGCAHNYYNVPRESYEKKVRVLGVAPFFVDGDSDVRPPEREAVIALINDLNRKNEAELVARLKDTGVYLAVRMPDAQADQLFSSLFFRRERRSDAGVLYNKYFFKQDAVKEFIVKNNLDAVMLVTVSGLTRTDKLYSSNYLAYLESDCNYLIMTAQIMDADGNVLWEYPNFQDRLRPLKPLLNLQYADFDEADANVTDKVDLKFKTLPGITRAFEKPASYALLKNGKISRLYNAQFDEMVSLLEPEFKFPWEKEDKGGQPGPEPRQATSAAPSPAPKAVAVEPAKSEPAATAVTTDPPPLSPGEIKTDTLK
ncbi:MAG TPA: hypothetical protein VI298_12970 [Geobacteraceae bacterium]